MPKKLLLADDSVTIQRVIELTFADEDIQVIAVGDGQQAIARIDADRPDVVLADIGMPERDGYEVASHVKGRPETSHIPVLLLTGAFEPVDEARARASGCDGVLVKPFEPQMVIHRVKDLLAGHRPASLWGGAPASHAQPASARARAEHTSAGEPSGRGGEAGAAATDGPPPDHKREAGAPGATRSADSLDAYFDRLDAAFSSDSAPPAPDSPVPFPVQPAKPTSTVDYDFGGWDLPSPVRPAAAPADEISSSARPQAAPEDSAVPEPLGSAPAAPGGGPAQGISPASTTEPPLAAPGLSLASAFDALLAAERRAATQSTGGASSAANGAPVALDDRTLDEIVTRVLARMTDEAVKATVLDVAERLVREEIDRIKQQAKL